MDVIVNEFQQNWSLFQRIHSDIYLELVKVNSACFLNVLFCPAMRVLPQYETFFVLLQRLSHHFSQKVELVEVIETENNEVSFSPQQ